MKAPKQPLLPIAGLALLCFVAYSNSFHVPFQFDDDRLIRFNFSLRNLKDWSGVVHSEFFRPLTMLSLALNFQLSQKNPVSYHIVNLLLHIANTVLLYLLLIRLSPNRMFCWISAALFAVHPLNTEAVTYISSRSILLCAFFYLLAVLSFDSHLRQPRWYHAFCFFAFFFLAAMSKEEAGLIPFAALMYNFLFLGAASVRKHRWLHVSSLLLVLAAILFRLQAELQSVGPLPHPLLVYWPTEVFVWLRYLGLAIFPVFLNVDHGIVPLTMNSGVFWISAGGVLAILAGLYWMWRKGQVIPVFWGMWFFLNLLASSVIPLNDFMAEHRAYLSTMGFCTVTGALLMLMEQWKRRRSVMLTLSLGVLVLFYGSVTFMRNRIWFSKVTLWFDAVQKSPENYRPHINLGYALFQVGAVDDALKEYFIARSLNPGIGRIHTGIGFCYLQKGRSIDAIENFQKALQVEPNSVDPKTGLGMVFFRQNQFREAVYFFEQTLPWRQESPELIAMMSICYLRNGELQKALSLLESKQQLDPKLQEGRRLVQRGLTEQGIEILGQLTKL